jgi:two-component system LytT family response regulator
VAPHAGTIERAPTREVIVKTGTRSLRIDMMDVDWIEARGNSVALHVGTRAHLFRQTLKTFAAQLDKNRFVRIHRSTVVALDRIESLRSDIDGEATLLLSTGQELRVSETHRRNVRERWGSSRHC